MISSPWVGLNAGMVITVNGVAGIAGVPSVNYLSWTSISILLIGNISSLNAKRTASLPLRSDSASLQNFIFY